MKVSVDGDGELWLEVGSAEVRPHRTAPHLATLNYPLPLVTPHALLFV